MSGLEKYNNLNGLLLEEYERTVRSYLKEGLFKGADTTIADIIPYIRDGVIDPQTWFNNDDFRPLFIMKETSCGKDKVSQLEAYRKEWKSMTRFEFVTNPYDDIQLGSFSDWIRIATLAYGLYEMHYSHNLYDYYVLRNSLKYIKGKQFAGAIDDPYYVHEKYRYRTANEKYDFIMSKIAVVEMKKIVGGTTTSSEMSCASGWYLDHIDEEHRALQLLFEKQIDLIQPTVIIGCGRQNGQCISAYLPDTIKTKYKDRIIDGFHPNRNSNENFYYLPIKKYAEVKNIHHIISD